MIGGRENSGIFGEGGLGPALSSADTELVVVRADGEWYLRQNGTVRRQNPLPRAAAERLVRELPEDGVGQGQRWWVHRTRGPMQTAVFSLRPRAENAGLSPQSLELVKSQLPRDCNGIVFGNYGPARSALLLNLARFLPPELIVYVSASPPVAPPSVDFLHLLPPADDRERQENQVLLQGASAVLVDTTVSRETLRWAFSGDPRNRWCVQDVAEHRRWLADGGLTLPWEEINVQVGIQGSALQPGRLSHLSVRVGELWQVLLSEESEVKLPERTIAQNPRVSAQITSPVQRISQISPVDPIEERGSRQISDFDVSLLLEDELEELDASLLESGEIDVPGFISRRMEVQQVEDTSISDAPTSILRGERMDQQLPYLIGRGDVDDVEIPEVRVEQLRQTMDSSYDPKRLEVFRTMRRHSLEEASASRETAEETPGAPRRVVSSRGGTLMAGSQRAISQGAPSQRVLPAPSSRDLNEPVLEERSNPTEELDLGDLLDNLRTHRKKQKDES